MSTNQNTNDVLNYILILSFLFLMVLYLNQKKQFKNKYVNQSTKNNTIKSEQKNNHIDIDIDSENNTSSNNKQICSTKRESDFVEFTNGKMCLGPVKDFHKHFNNNNDSNYLGWRNWWDKNARESKLCNDDATNNNHPLMTSFFKNQENTTNIYL
tara:strand:- start:52 stop:516 length:465 start_codon:yes stop_codon:yes gene_type:complete